MTHATEVTTKYGNTYTWYRTNRDVNGNPRYIIHYKDLGLKNWEATKKTRNAGLRLYRGKDFGGGFVMQTHAQQSDSEILEQLGLCRDNSLVGNEKALTKFYCEVELNNEGQSMNYFENFNLNFIELKTKLYEMLSAVSQVLRRSTISAYLTISTPYSESVNFYYNLNDGFMLDSDICPKMDDKQVIEYLSEREVL